MADKDVQKRVKKLISFMTQELVEKDEAVKLALLASVAGESVFFLGPPGTAKSMVSRKLSEIIKLDEEKSAEQTKYFEYLMNQMSTPDEVFGPVKITELEKDNYERNTMGFLPSANVVFLDEIWKAGPVILNTLLTIINEKKFHNGNKVMKVPLKALISASNELPSKDGRNGSLEALWDRFLVRLIVNRITEDSDFLSMICKDDNGKEKVSVKEIEPLLLSTKELEEWQEDGGAIDRVEVPETVRTILLEIRKDWDAKGADHYVSDRRWKKIVRLLKASAFLNGRSEVDLMDCLLIKHCIWNTIETDAGKEESSVDQIRDAEQIVKDCIIRNCGTVAAPVDEIKQKVADFDTDVYETFAAIKDFSDALKEKLIKMEDQKYDELSTMVQTSLKTLDEEVASRIQAFRTNVFGDSYFSETLEQATSKARLDLEEQLSILAKIKENYHSGNVKKGAGKSITNTQSASSQILDPSYFVEIKNFSRPFYINKHQVKQNIYEKVMGYNPSHFKAKTKPVECVSWYDAIYFCNRLSEIEGVEPVYSVNGTTDVTQWGYAPHQGDEISGNITQDLNADGYRLPTEEEWEYAAKGGKNYTYSGSNNLDEVGWYSGNTDGQTHAVGKKKPNGYGLYDMSGNVWEWCWDASSGSNRYNRGGSYRSYDSYCKVSYGSGDSANGQLNDVGFRIVRSC